MRTSFGATLACLTATLAYLILGLASLRVDAQVSLPKRQAKASARPLHVIGTVTAHGSQPFNQTPTSQRVFPREAYRDRGEPAASSILDETPGAFVARPLDEDLAVPNVPVYPLVRGGLPYETPVAIDGALVALPSSGTLDLSLIPTFVLQQVEVVRGPGDPAGLGGGVDGAINFLTAEPTAATRGMLELAGDSLGGEFTDFAYDGTMPGGKFSYASMLSVDGDPGSLAGLSLPGSPASDSLRKSLLLKARLAPDDNVTVTATVLAVNLDRALAGAYGALLDNAFVSLAPELGARQDERLRFEQLSGQYERGDDDLELRVYSFDLGNDGYAANADLASALDRERGAGLSWNHASGPNLYTLSFDASADSAYEDDVSSFAIFGTEIPEGSGDVKTRTRAAAALHPSERTEVDLSAEAVDDAERLGYGAVHDWPTFDARAGLSQSLTPALSLRGSIGTSGVAPPLDMLATGVTPQIAYGLPTESVLSLSDIARTEQAQGADVGLEWRLHGETTTLSFDLYSTGTRSAYVLAATQPVPGIIDATWMNAPPMRDEGAELSLVQFKPVGLGYVVQASLPRTYLLSGALPANVAGVPYFQGYGEISYKWPRGSRASFGLLCAGANNPYGRGGFTTFNANLELSIGAKSKLAFALENLFGALDGRLPVLFAGLPAMLPDGETIATDANVLGPPTIRVMFRQAIGGGRIYEH